MISKCENVVINRVKFSEFEGYDPASEPTDGLKLVGYIETDAGKRNISVDYGKILKKNGEIPARGIIINAEAISSSDIISNNIVCEQVTGFKIDANDLEFIQINGLSEKNYIKDGYLPISFASASYAIGQECALFLHNIPANICIYTPVLSAENAIYDEIKTDDLAGHSVNALIIFTKVKHSSYGEVMMPTQTFVAEDDKAFHVYAPTIVKDEVSSPVSRMLPASNANLDAVAMRVSDLEARSLAADISFKEVESSIADTNTKIDNSVTEINDRISAEIEEVNAEISKVADVSAEALSSLHEILDDKIEEVKENLEQAADIAAADLVKILHIKKFNSKDELNNWISELDPSVKVKELSRTIALIRHENDTYEEYVCVNPDQADGNPLEWDRLGAVDSIYATHEATGSVKLVHNVNEHTINTYIDTNIAGDIFPKSGLAVAPIALKDLYDKHNINVANIDGIAADLEETKKAVDVINKELEIKTDTDEATSSRIDGVDADIEHLKNIIGLNGCHGESCSCATHECNDLTGACTILCRVSENENDISKISASIPTEVARLETIINENVTAINNTITDMAETVGTYTDAEIARVTAETTKNAANIAENTAKIDKNTSDIADIKANFVQNDTLSELIDIIGLNGCHNNESCSEHHCENISGKCTILCRIGENERDISQISVDISEIDKNIDDISATIAENAAQVKNQFAATAEYVDGKFEEIQSKFTVCEDELKRIDAAAATNKDNIAEIGVETRRIAAELVRIETSELTALKDADATFEAEVSRLDSDINKQITTIAALESDIAEVRTAVESNAATNSEAHSNIITRLTKLESDYTSDKTYKEIAQTNMVYGTQAYNEVIVVKSTVEELKNVVRTNSSTVASIESRITTAESLVNDSNEKAGFAITTASNASEKAILADTKADNALHNSSEAVRTAELAKDTAEHIVAEVHDLIKDTQSIHSTLFSFKNGAATGEFTIKCADDFPAFDSAYYNFAVVETRSASQVVYPSVEFIGSVDSNKADNREIKVTTGRENEPTLITVLAYRAEQHVVEK